jgi:hypothetical protein
MIGPFPVTQRGAVLAGVNAKPCGWPAASVDPPLRAAPLEPAAGTRLEEPTQNKIRQSEVSTLSGDGHERGWRDFKGALGLRPVFHHREDRIRAHIQLCWLALLLLRVIENATGDTWRNARHELDRMHLVTLATNAGQVAQRTTTTPGQQTLLRALDLPEPPRIFDYTLPSSS